MRKLLAYPAYLSTRACAAIWPEKAAETGWNGQFDLRYMYPSGYVFGAVCWLVAIGLVGGGIALAL